MTGTAYINKFLTRDYRDDDYIKVVHLWKKTDMASPERGDDKETIKRTISLGGCLLLLEEKSTGQICGTSWMTFDGRRLLLHHFGILPEFQGNGLAKILLEKTLDIAKERGYQIKIEVHRTNKGALNLYKKSGFLEMVDYGIFILRDPSKI